MPYLGNTPSTSFATIVKDTFNGGSTGYTLSKVATTNSVSVFVENVRQEPTTAYSVSGTTLTFTATTPSGTGNIYVLHMNPTTTTTHPAAQALTATSGTFSAGVSGTTGTFTGDVTVDTDTLKVDASEDTVCINTTDTNFDAGADDLIVGSGSGDSGITIYTGSSVGDKGSIFFADSTVGSSAEKKGQISYEQNNEIMTFLTNDTLAMQIDLNGNVTMPKQPSFHAVSTGSGFTHDSIMVFNTALLNVGSNYNTSNGKFTAPVAGVYFFYHHNIGTSASTVIRVKVYYNDSIFNTYKQIATRQDTSQGNDYAEGHITFAVSLSANDTIKLGAFADDSSSGIYNDNSGGQGFNYFGGYLIG